MEATILFKLVSERHVHLHWIELEGVEKIRKHLEHLSLPVIMEYGVEEVTK